MEALQFHSSTQWLYLAACPKIPTCDTVDIHTYIFFENEKFSIVYRKKSFRGVYTNFRRFIPKTHKIYLIKSL